MRLGTIRPEEWETFLHRFADDHREWMTTVELHRLGQIPERVVEGLPLRRITLDAHGSAPEVRVEAATGRFVTVAGPTEVRVAELGPGEDALLQITLDRDRRALVHVWRAAGAG